jgi:lipopolysaccharide export system ATP-binding protein
VKIPFLSSLSAGKPSAPDPFIARDKARYEGTLVAHGLSKSYDRRRVVNGVSLVVRRGEAVGLLGPNGAGKTTCFYMITGLVPVDEGMIAINGNEVTRMPMYRRARLGVGYLPQEASIFRGLSVEDNIRAVLEVHETNRDKRESKLDELRRKATARNCPSAGDRPRLHASR